MQLKPRLLSFYGDDFTGSTDAMEALTISGFKTVLFLEPPTKDLLDEQFPDVQCIGVAGTSRTMTPEQMEQDLTPLFTQIKELGAPINHYKICSTFDSSPSVGNIGKVLEIILKINDTQSFVPILAGVPPLARYTVFGNHFAKVKEKVFRLDEHPVMSKHPITPMQEANLLKHLGKQTNLSIALMDITFMNNDDLNIANETNRLVREEGAKGLLFDVTTEDNLTRIGELIWEGSEDEQQFVVGSSGVEYALTNYWNTKENMNLEYVNKKEGEQVEKEQVLIVSGSCSAITSDQIKYALDNEFTGLKVSPAKLMKSASYSEELLTKVIRMVDAGENVIVYSALGSEDSSIMETREYLESIGVKPADSGQLLGVKFGELIKTTVERTSLKRIVIAGGDTSSYATLEMGIYALEMIKRVAPGAPLCKAYSNDPRFDGLEIALKGGQLGQVDYFTKVHQGSGVKV